MRLRLHLGGEWVSLSSGSENHWSSALKWEVRVIPVFSWGKVLRFRWSHAWQQHPHRLSQPALPWTWPGLSSATRGQQFTGLDLQGWVVRGIWWHPGQACSFWGHTSEGFLSDLWKPFAKAFLSFRFWLLTSVLKICLCHLLEKGRSIT